MLELEFAKDILIQASQIDLTDGTHVVRRKRGHGNWVTKSDLAIEDFICDAITQRFPSHALLAEERTTTEQVIPSAKTWVLDPLDGTTNFTFGVPQYAISLALLERGTVQLGAICDLPHQTMYWAERGKGAFAQGSVDIRPRRLLVHEVGLRGSIACTGSPYSSEDFAPNWRLMEKVHAAGSRIIMLGSAVMALCYAAEGRIALYYERGLKPWDLAAGTLLVSEAMGAVTSLEGELDLLHPGTLASGSTKAVAEFLSLVREPSE